MQQRLYDPQNLKYLVLVGKSLLTPDHIPFRSGVKTDLDKQAELQGQRDLPIPGLCVRGRLSWSEALGGVCWLLGEGCPALLIPPLAFPRGSSSVKGLRQIGRAHV